MKQVKHHNVFIYFTKSSVTLNLNQPDLFGKIYLRAFLFFSTENE